MTAGDISTFAEPALPRALGWLLRLIDGAIVLGGLGLLLIVFGNATLRLVLTVDLNASLELGSFLMLWVTFLGAAAAAARDSHMRVTEVVAAFGARTRRCLELAVDLAVVLVLLSLIWYGGVITISNWPEETTVLYWPVGVHYLAMPVGSLLTLVFVLHHAARRHARPRPGPGAGR